MKNSKTDANFHMAEKDSLNVTYDSIEYGNRDLRAPYRGEFNRVPPRFKGMPRDYYPTTCLSLC